MLYEKMLHFYIDFYDSFRGYLDINQYATYEIYDI